MSDESMPTSPDSSPAYNPALRMGTGLAGETTRNDGGTILPDPHPRPLEVIGDFEVLAKLGQGGMGAVYRARQISLDRQVALKILPSHFEADSDYVTRFQREARVAGSLKHANLVKVYASGQADGSHYIAMELIEGETLGQWVKRGALPPLEALRITLDVARALECGWRTAQLIHRDVKPGNIFLSIHGDVKLGDLGLAKTIGGDSTGLTHTGAAMGTPHYISPEQARGEKDLDFRADIYSLGCTLFQMLTGRTPYEGREPVVVVNQHINAAPPAILKVMPQCPIPLARLVGKMLKKQRRERHTSYEELIAAIESVQAHLDPSLAAPTLLPTFLPATPPSGDIAAQTPRLPGSSAPSASAGASARPSAAPKSNLAIYGAIGVLVVAAAAFFLWPREEQLTRAQMYARDHARSPQAGGEAAPAIPAESGASTASLAEPWQDLMHDPAKLVLSGGAERMPEGVRFSDAGDARLSSEGSRQRDGAVRMIATFGGLHPMLRTRTTTGVGQYLLHVREENLVVLGRYLNAGSQNTDLRKFPLREPLKEGQDYELELRVVGQTLTAKFNGEVLGTVTDGSLAEGHPGVSVFEHNRGPALIKALEVLDLDAAGSGSAASAAATKDAPYVNSLGMKFVPMPIIGGPTGGKRVLFSVWDTRVQDYEVFARETEREWLKPTFAQGPTHPAVAVSWDDARAFCEWLTERERKAGKLGANEVYRLPSDHEWSCAVGIGEMEDAAKLPGEKAGKITDAFPWGSGWPPPVGAGNYAGEELRPALAAGKYAYLKDGIAGYNDGFVNTSPVGSFAANRFGLFDLGGNVWQWCEDWYDKAQKERVLRGAAWNKNDRIYLLSSLRDRNAPDHRSEGIGFRCVLVTSAASPALSAGTYPQPRVWIDDTEHVRSGLKDGSLVVDGEWLVATKALWLSLAGGKTLRDSAVRVVFSNGLEVYMRNSGKHYEGHIAQHVSIGLVDSANHTRTDLKGGVDLPPGYTPEDAHELVFTAQGDQLSLWLDGKKLADARDTTLTAGTLDLFLFHNATGFSRIKKVEYGELEAPGVGQAPTTPGAARLSPSAEPWQDVLHDPAKLDPHGGVERMAEGLRFTDYGGAMVHQGPKRDGALRLLATFGGLRVELCARDNNAVGHYQLSAKNEKTVVLGRYDYVSKQSTSLREFPLRAPLQPGQDYEVELRVVGQTLTVKCNGEILGTVTDGTFAEGGFGLGLGVHNGAPTLIKALEVLDLDAAGGATKD